MTTTPAVGVRADRASLVQWGLLALAAAVPLALALGLRLNGDVQQTIGSINVAGDGLLGAADVFTHRPLVYRVYVGFLHQLVAVAWEPGSTAYELALRGINMLVAAGAGLVMGAGLRRYMSSPIATAAGAAAGLGLALAPAWGFLQPEWLSGLCVVAAVGGALLPRGARTAALLSGLFVTLAVAMKLATAPLALLALGAILLVDRRRAIAATLGAGFWGVAWLAVSLGLPRERQWLLDMIAFAPGSPWRNGLDLRDLDFAVRSIGSKAVLQPVILLVPAALVALVQSAPEGRRLALVGGALFGLLLAVLPMLVQGVWYLFHAEMLPVVAAALVAIVLARSASADRPGAVALLVAGSVAASAMTVVFLSADPAWRELRIRWLLLAAGALGLGLALMVGLLHRWRPRVVVSSSRAGVVAAAMVCLLSVPALLPDSAWSLDPRITPRSNASWAAESFAQREAMALLSQDVGEDTPVLYLAFGDVAYYMANPTDCDYPSPAFLMASTRLAYVRELPSYHDNLRCLSSPVPEYVVVQPGWIFRGPLTGDLVPLIEATYDCLDPLTERGIEACPRR